MKDYKLKPKEYFSNARNDLIRYVPKNRKQRILEIGAGTCDTLLTLKNNGYSDFVVGVDLIELDDSNQKNPLIDEFIIGNIEDIDLEYIDFFDVIILGDILEHLVNPWDALNKISKYLRGGGIIISSIPNFLYYKNLFTVVIRADFKYQDQGILDKTHLRFFCKKNIIELFENNNLHVDLVSSRFDIEKGIKYQFCRIFKYFHKFFVTQYHCIASLK